VAWRHGMRLALARRRPPRNVLVPFPIFLGNFFSSVFPRLAFLGWVEVEWSSCKGASRNMGGRRRRKAARTLDCVSSRREEDDAMSPWQ